jgi:hypothetical protein
MPKDRKETFSDRQSQASRTKRQAKKKTSVSPKKQTAKREDFSQAAARIVKHATDL